MTAPRIFPIMGWWQLILKIVVMAPHRAVAVVAWNFRWMFLKSWLMIPACIPCSIESFLSHFSSSGFKDSRKCNCTANGRHRNCRLKTAFLYFQNPRKRSQMNKKQFFYQLLAVCIGNWANVTSETDEFIKMSGFWIPTILHGWLTLYCLNCWWCLTAAFSPKNFKTFALDFKMSVAKWKWSFQF